MFAEPNQQMDPMPQMIGTAQRTQVGNYADPGDAEMRMMGMVERAERWQIAK